MLFRSNSTSAEISTAILQCESFIKLGINDKISEMLTADKELLKDGNEGNA